MDERLENAIGQVHDIIQNRQHLDINDYEYPSMFRNHTLNTALLLVSSALTGMSEDYYLGGSTPFVLAGLGLGELVNAVTSIRTGHDISPIEIRDFMTQYGIRNWLNENPNLHPQITDLDGEIYYRNPLNFPIESNRAEWRPLVGRNRPILGHIERELQQQNNRHNNRILPIIDEEEILPIINEEEIEPD